MDLFVYGTLMQPAVVRELTGHTFASRPARLPDYRCILEPGHYPYILPEAGCSVAGLLLLAVDPIALAQLDSYEDEGTLYFRRTVSVVVDDSLHACQTYVGNPAAVEALRLP